MWIGAKDLSNWVIAGSLRNAFRGSLGKATDGGRALIGLAALPGYRRLSNSEYHLPSAGSETVGAKLHSREGNSPDHRLRPLNGTQSLRM